jgi:hypothetical protein
VVPAIVLVQVKSALSVFDCSRNKDGVLILDADPSIRCNEVGEALVLGMLSMKVPCVGVGSAPLLSSQGMLRKNRTQH